MNISGHNVNGLLKRMISGGVRENDDLETRLRISLINVFSVMGTFALILFGVTVLKEGNFTLGFFDLFFASILIIIQIHLRRTGTYSSARYFIISSVGAFFIYLFATGGVDHTGHLWPYTFPLFSSFLLGSRKGAFANLAFFTSSLLLLWVINPLFQGLKIYSVDFSLRFIISFLIVSLSSYFYEHFREKTQEMLKINNAEMDGQIAKLKEAEEALKRNQDELERRVENRTHELKSANEELQKEVLERRKTEELFRASEEKYRLLFDNSLDIIYSIDRQLKVVSVSPSVERALGYKPGELIGKAIYELNLIPQKYMELAFSHIMRIFGGESIPASEYEFFAKDGTIKIAQISGAPVFRNGEVVGVISIARDITEAKEGELFLRRSEETAKKLAHENWIMAEIGKLISSTLRIEEVYERFASEVRKLIPFDRIVVNLINLESATATIAYVAGSYLEGRQVGDVFPLNRSALLEVVRTRSGLLVQPETAEELESQFPTYALGFHVGLRSMMVLPLISHGAVIGALHFRLKKDKAYTDQDLRLGESIASQIAGAIANAQLFAERKRAEGELRRAHALLEMRVRERTAELVKANDDLQIEVMERQQAQQELKRAKDLAEDANRTKSEFLANMSHELRTPLNHILGFTELVANRQCGDLNPEQEEYLKDVLQSGQHLLALINDILDLSKVEAGKLTLEIADLYLQPLLENSLTMVKEKASTHRIRLSTEFDGIPEVIQGDERKLKQILYNLLSNAVKFTPDGGSVRLRASLILDFGCRMSDLKKETEDSVIRIPQSAIGISVEDTGIGIKGEDLRRIFDPFEQVESSASRRFQGTGLGLSLTKRLVELHGGRIWAESEGVGKGSKFTFLIPG